MELTDEQFAQYEASNSNQQSDYLRLPSSSGVSELLRANVSTHLPRRQPLCHPGCSNDEQCGQGWYSQKLTTPWVSFTLQKRLLIQCAARQPLSYLYMYVTAPYINPSLFMLLCAVASILTTAFHTESEMDSSYPVLLPYTNCQEALGKQQISNRTDLVFVGHWSNWPWDGSSRTCSAATQSRASELTAPRSVCGLPKPRPPVTDYTYQTSLSAWWCHSWPGDVTEAVD